MSESSNFETIEAYIDSYPSDIKEKLLELYQIIKGVVPEAEEKISYNMPAFFLNGILVYFAGYKKHIGFYPTGNGVDAFINKIGEYKFSKGTIQFPLNKPLPRELIKEIVEYRKQENLNKKNIKRKS
jgi:Uncharacterized conserved protein